MENTLKQSADLKSDIQQEIKDKMAQIKSLQRELIKASFKQSSAPGTYQSFLSQINELRGELKLLNQQLSQR